ncbi:MAG: hypothetical protein M1824_001062 [Vezdaea acicularis]|nr:MAG: hypothetical protein M1824_001062 [Vezdaea acicularis]
MASLLSTAPSRTSRKFYTLLYALHQPSRTQHSLRSTHRRTLISSSKRQTHASSDLRETVRLSLRQLPHPVVLITAWDTPFPPTSPTPLPASPSFPSASLPTIILPPSAPPSRSPHGLTVSSLTSTTLLPAPILSFNIRLNSSTFAAIQSSKRFLISYLRPNNQGVCIAQRFASGLSTPFDDLGIDGELGSEPDTMAHLREVWSATTATADGAKRQMTAVDEVRREDRKWDAYGPVLGGLGVGSRIACEIAGPEGEGWVAVKDHAVVFGKVRKAGLGGEEEAVRKGVVYVDGRYRAVGRFVDEGKAGGRRGGRESP